MGESVDPYPTLTLALENGDVKKFHMYWVCLLIK